MCLYILQNRRTNFKDHGYILRISSTVNNEHRSSKVWKVKKKVSALQKCTYASNGVVLIDKQSLSALTFNIF